MGKPLEQGLQEVELCAASAVRFGEILTEAGAPEGTYTTALGGSDPMLIIGGDATEQGTDMGPLSSVEARDTLVELLDDARSHGAEFLTGGTVIEGDGAFIEPTVITGVTEDMRAFQEELFGPVAMIFRVTTIEEAIELANNTPFGLSGSVWSDDIERATDVARQINAGMVYVNEHGTTMPGLPFGGVKRSGYGRELASYGVHEFANHKLVRVSAK